MRTEQVFRIVVSFLNEFRTFNENLLHFTRPNVPHKESILVILVRSFCQSEINEIEGNGYQNVNEKNTYGEKVEETSFENLIILICADVCLFVFPLFLAIIFIF